MREDLLITRGPRQADQVVYDSFGKIAHIAVSRHRSSAVTLAQARLVRPKNERHVSERGRLPAQSLIKLDLPWRVREVVVAANGVSDGHIDVVDDDTEVIGWSTVGTGDDEIVELAIVEDYVAFDGVLDHSCPFTWRTKPNG